MRAIIFTEGGPQIGLGHLSRCISLYDELVSRGIETLMIINGLTELLEVIGSRICLLKNWLCSDYLKTLIQSDDYCIIDSYLATGDSYNLIAQKAYRCLYIDDQARISYPKGIIVNPSLYFDVSKYNNQSKTRIYNGPEYVIVRKEFIGIKRKQVVNKKREILLTVGGSDIRKLLPRITGWVLQQFQETHINILIGHVSEEIELLALDPRITIYQNVVADVVKELMLRSDLAITAAGQTIYEMLVTKTPFIPIIIIDNQKDNIEGLIKYKLNQRAVHYDDPNLKAKLMHMIASYQPLIDIESKNTVDGKGAERIIDKFLNLNNDGEVI